MNVIAPVRTPLAYRGLWEMAGGYVACRVLICAIALNPDEFAGMIAGYFGGSGSLLEPFHVQFVREQAKHLIVGDLNALTRKKSYSETWPLAVRQAVAACRVALKQHAFETPEGLWAATPAEQARLKPLARDPDCATSSGGTPALDIRVWTTVSAHFGTPVGLEAT